MNAICLEGNRLGGGTGGVEITSTDRFSLYLNDGCRKPLHIDYDIDNIWINDHVVSIGNKYRVRVVEHLFSALYAMNQFSVRIDVHGNEIPFFDGSSREFVRALRELPDNACPGIRGSKPISIDENGSSISYTPLPNDELTIEMCLKHPYIAEERIALHVDAGTYEKEIAPARTFVFTTEDDPRLRNIPAYGIGITAKGVYSAAPLRFQDEPVRHKILDLLGDLYVLGRPLYGRICGKNTSHGLNLEFARRLISTIKESSG